MAKSGEGEGDGDQGRARDAQGGTRDQAARRIERAMIELAGEHGYENVTVAMVLARSGANRTLFYSLFDSKAGCFEAAYAAALEELGERLLSACQEDSSWAGAMRRGLEELAAFVGAEPGLARGVLTDPQTVSEQATTKRQEVFRRLTRAVDCARREIPGSRHAPPPVTAPFIVSAIEASVLRFLSDPEDRDFEVEIPSILSLAVEVYLGPGPARAELRALAKASSGPGRAPG